MAPGSSIAVVGSGISGLSAAWLLASRYNVTLFERDGRIGGHSNTVDATWPGRPERVPVDTGFIVYNTQCYPNLVAMFDHLQVRTARSNMSFAVSFDSGGYEYSGTGFSGIFGQRTNLLRPSHYRMLMEIRRFFRDAPALLAGEVETSPSLGAYLSDKGYSDAFVKRHIVPMAAAIWSAPATEVLQFPAAAFVRFFANHGLLQIKNRPEWRTVAGGSREYVKILLAKFSGAVAQDRPVHRIVRDHDGVTIVGAQGERQRFDACLIATHADEALALLESASPAERGLLGNFRYQQNRAVLHSDERVMPRRRSVWSSWNYTSAPRLTDEAPSVTYWMNRLQPLGDVPDTFVTLNPVQDIAPAKIIRSFDYAHPVFDRAAMLAQKQLWNLQGQQRTWFAGSYFGYGFHEDGLQSGLAAAESIGGVRRPWRVAGESNRLHITSSTPVALGPLMEAAE